MFALSPFYILVCVFGGMVRRGYFMQTKHLCVLIHIWTKGGLCAVRLVKALQ